MTEPTPSAVKTTPSAVEPTPSGIEMKSSGVETRPGGPARSSPDRQVGVTDPLPAHQRPEGPTPPFQFTLRQLFVTMAAMCVATALVSWLGLGASLFVLVLVT